MGRSCLQKNRYLMEWIPRLGKLSVRGSEERWIYDLEKMGGSGWMRTVYDRENWRFSGTPSWNSGPPAHLQPAAQRVRQLRQVRQLRVPAARAAAPRARALPRRALRSAARARRSFLRFRSTHCHHVSCSAAKEKTLINDTVPF